MVLKLRAKHSQSSENSILQLCRSEINSLYNTFSFVRCSQDTKKNKKISMMVCTLNNEISGWEQFFADDIIKKKRIKLVNSGSGKVPITTKRDKTEVVPFTYYELEAKLRKFADPMVQVLTEVGVKLLPEIMLYQDSAYVCIFKPTNIDGIVEQLSHHYDVTIHEYPLTKTNNLRTIHSLYVRDALYTVADCFDDSIESYREKLLVPIDIYIFRALSRFTTIEKNCLTLMPLATKEQAITWVTVTEGLLNTKSQARAVEVVSKQNNTSPAAVRAQYERAENNFEKPIKELFPSVDISTIFSFLVRLVRILLSFDFLRPAKSTVTRYVASSS